MAAAWRTAIGAIVTDPWYGLRNSWNYLIDFEDIQRMPEVDRLEYKATSDGADVLGEGLTGKRRAPNTHRAGVSGAGSGARGAGLVPNSSIEDIATGLERSSGSRWIWQR